VKICSPAGPNRIKRRAALQKLPFLVVQDTRMTETVKLAHVVLPATHFGEKDGTYTNRQAVCKTQRRADPRKGPCRTARIFMRCWILRRGKNGYTTTAGIFAALSREVFHLWNIESSDSYR